ncbi:hypothetical protein [Oceanicaulis sp.]|jgi:hypothetical protein|uniref:hypothetical protein n=1 Tax=Oceanicaulis sp. TaxID=1924941 RepID=UPI000D2FBBCB
MKILFGLVAAASSLTLVACAADPNREARIRTEIDAQLAMADEEGLVCEYRQVFGSLRRERVCMTPEDVARNSDAGRTQVERMQRSTTPVVGGS